MIVDVHYHMIPRVSERIVSNMIEDPIRTARIMGKDLDPETLKQRAFETYPDPTGEKLIASMDEAGIDFTCICAVDNAGNERLTVEIMQAYNKTVADIARKYPNRLMAIAGVDPRRPEGPDMLRQCFGEFGMGGLKYHPDDGYDPSSPESYKLLQIVQDRGGILLTHTGPLGPPSRCRYSDPMLLADLAVDFPDLKVIAAHMGQIDWRPWAALASHQPNLHGDLAMWDSFAFGRYELFCRELRDLIDYAGVSKVLFATDNPVFSIIQHAREWVQLIAALPNQAPSGIRFTEEEVEAILGGNAARLLGLNPEG
jgi:predicted TIM-barrel fold metal-dependent hydrolase